MSLTTSRRNEQRLDACDEDLTADRGRRALGCEDDMRMDARAIHKWRVVGGVLAAATVALGFAGGPAYVGVALASLAAGFVVTRPRPFRVAGSTVYGLGPLVVVPYCAVFVLALVIDSTALELALVAVAAGACLRLSFAGSDGRWGAQRTR
jgi:hypothetical protein